MALGAVDRAINEQYYTEVLVTLFGDMSKGLAAMGVTEVEVTDTITHVDFGEIEPDWGYEE